MSEMLPGQSFPLGATVFPDGVNFCVFSKNAQAVELLLFSDPHDRKPQVLILDPGLNKTFYYWHVFVPGIGEGQLYGWRAHGPNSPMRGMRFDGSKVLVDPYTRAVCTQGYVRRNARCPGDNVATCMKSVVVNNRVYDWEGDHPLRIPHAASIIYELHVGGFTRHPNSGLEPRLRGTYAGLIEKIPYLKSLGITAVELMPVQQFDAQDCPDGLTNYWGYSPIALFAPHSGYSSDPSPLGAVNEFRAMVKALHKAGIEVILDVVFNHTAEGGQGGPTLSFRGLENIAYYIPGADRSMYANFSGCGNTLNTNFSIMRRLIEDCLRYWVREMHVDGFRFDLASIMSRDEKGEPLENPPILWSIESDPVLAGAKIIAEAWDAAGLYQVGSFIGDRFAEWNGHYREDVRRFFRGDTDMVEQTAARIMASPDIYPEHDREPNRSINFITCHDGFTLNDLVTYEKKHNEANGEKNRDGMNDNYCWNCGVEGPTDKSQIEKLRLRQIKNFLTVLFFSQGTPMLLMGDEVRRTQQGNNNAYCQDNELSWFDWSLTRSNAGLLKFTSALIGFAQSLRILKEDRILDTSGSMYQPGITWHGVKLGKPDLASWSHSLAFTYWHPEGREHLHVMLNAYTAALDFELPILTGKRKWVCIINTALDAPDDFSQPEIAQRVSSATLRLEAHSVAVLLAWDL